MTAQQILERKGYDNFECNEIIAEGSESLDAKVRGKFNVHEPVHLWDGYYLGDADEDEMNKVAKQNGFESYDDLLSAMDTELNSLAEQIGEK